MAQCLIALGSNLGDRPLQLRAALDRLARVPSTRILARSAWHETAPVGGPGGQQPFLNGAVLASTAWEPQALLGELLEIESLADRVRDQRWAPRTLDLDLLLYDAVQCTLPEVVAPHPRMHFRRFVLEPAAEVAPWMVHPTSGWTIGQLLAQLDNGANHVAVAAADLDVANSLVNAINNRLDAGAPRKLRAQLWTAEDLGRRDFQLPKLLMAIAPLTGGDMWQQRKMLQLPATGPVAWIPLDRVDRMLDEALSVLASAWPALVTTIAKD